MALPEMAPHTLRVSLQMRNIQPRFRGFSIVSLPYDLIFFMTKNIDTQILDAVLKANLLEVFEERQNPDANPLYVDRKGRNAFAATQLKKIKSVKNILNIGSGGERYLAACLGDKNIKVTEIDIQGDCDLLLDLDEIEKLPFEDGSFDVACAFDVLEHLENFHFINEELFRVAKDFVLISLPNSASEIFYDPLWHRAQKTRNLNSGVFSKFYGLPLKVPDDRHRWWLYFHDIVRFYYLFSLERDVKIEFWIPALTLKRKLFKAIFGKHIYYMFFCPFVWIKIYK